MEESEVSYLIKESLSGLGLGNDTPVSLINKGHSSYIYKLSSNFCLKINNKKRLSSNNHCFDNPILCIPIRIIPSMFSSATGYVMPFISGNTLQYYIKNHIHLSETEVAKIVFDVLDGINTLHRAGFVHRDLHPANIIIEPTKGGVSAKIIDFDELAPISGTTYACFRYSGYNAPEIVLNNDTYGEKAEVFAVGVMLWEMLFGNCPFAGYSFFGKYIETSWENYRRNKISIEKNLRQAISLIENYRIALTNINNDFADILWSLINPMPNERWTALKALHSDSFSRIVNH